MKNQGKKNRVTEQILTDYPVCPICKEHFSLYLKDLENYVYKTVNKDGTTYYCSKHCYDKALKEIQNDVTTRDNKKLLMLYGGELTLAECNFMEDLKLFIAMKHNKDYIQFGPIKTRKRFLEFIDKYGRYVDEIISIEKECKHRER